MCISDEQNATKGAIRPDNTVFCQRLFGFINQANFLIIISFNL